MSEKFNLGKKLEKFPNVEMRDAWKEMRWREKLMCNERWKMETEYEIEHAA